MPEKPTFLLDNVLGPGAFQTGHIETTDTGLVLQDPLDSAPAEVGALQNISWFVPVNPPAGIDNQCLAFRDSWGVHGQDSIVHHRFLWLSG
jgi:hypothetical protein